ncbi:ABC-type polar amino acid transport system ATPase subunit [Ewingella americana]
MSILKVSDLVKQFDGNRVLDGVNLTIAAGATQVIMGPSGCGKTTLIRCLNLLEQPTSGQISFHGEDLLGKEVDVRLLRSKIGFVFQSFALYRHLSVLDNVMLALRKIQGKSKEQARALAAGGAGLF